MRQVADSVDALVQKILLKPSAECSQYIMRLISSRLGSSHPDITLVSEQIKRKIKEETKNSPSSQRSMIKRFDTLLTKLLTQYPFVKNKE